MKTLSINIDTPELRERFDTQMLASPLSGDFVLNALAQARTVYLTGDIVAQGIPFKGDELTDEDGELHTVDFPVLELQERGNDRWAIGEEYQINLTEFFNLSQALIEQFFRKNPERMH